MNDIVCIDCEHFSDNEYYADNTMSVSVASFGSCSVCKKNITNTNPHYEIPEWCPKKKKNKDGRATGK